MIVTIAVCTLIVGLALGFILGIWWERNKPGEVEDGPLN